MGLGWKIKRIHDSITRIANADLQEMDLTISQHRTLLCLSHREGYEAELKELERYFGVAQATMAGIARRLEAKGYIVSFPCASDRRVKMVRLTDTGLELAERSLRRLRAHSQRMTAGMSPSEEEELARLLDLVYENIQRDTDAVSRERSRDI